MFDNIKKIAKECNIQECDGYMVNLWDDQDGSMRIRPDQFDNFCQLLNKEILNLINSPEEFAKVQEYLTK